jgi:hypothetical protein
MKDDGTVLTFGKDYIQGDTRMSLSLESTGGYHLKIKRMRSGDRGTYTCSDLSGKEIFERYSLEMLSKILKRFVIVKLILILTECILICIT